MSSTTSTHSPPPPPPPPLPPTKPIEEEEEEEVGKVKPITDSYTEQLCQKFHLDLNHSLNSFLPSSSSSSSEPLIQQIIKLIQHNNQHTLNLFQSSVQTLLTDVLDSVHTHFALDRAQQQLAEIDRQLISNAHTPDQETRSRLYSLLKQQKNQLTNQINQLENHREYQPTAIKNLIQPSPPPPPLNPNIHPNLQELTNPKPQSVSNHFSASTSTSIPTTTTTATAAATTTTTTAAAATESSSSLPSSSTAALLLSTKRKRVEHPNLPLEYDETLLDEFSIPDHLSYSQYLKRSKHRSLNLQHSISLNPSQEPSSSDISVQPIHRPASPNSDPHPSFLPHPALLENYFKPCSSGAKSSRRQSAILRNLVSAALGKLISHVTNNQQMHWPGSDTEERLAAIGLQIELLDGSKLTTEVIYKGPKNLQLQQCKRILLELELGLIRLKQIKAVPRPLRGSKKKFKPLDSPQPSIGGVHHPLRQSQSGLLAPSSSTPDILAIAPSSTTSSTDLAPPPTNNGSLEQSPNVLGKNFENCDPALLRLSPAFPGLSSSDPGPSSTAHSSRPDLPAQSGNVNHRDLVNRYMSSNVHPNTNPFVAHGALGPAPLPNLISTLAPSQSSPMTDQIDQFPDGDHEAFMDCDDEPDLLQTNNNHTRHNNHINDHDHDADDDNDDDDYGDDVDSDGQREKEVILAQKEVGRRADQRLLRLNNHPKQSP